MEEQRRYQFGEVIRRMLEEFIGKKKVTTKLILLSLVAAGFDIGAALIMKYLIDEMVRSYVSTEALGQSYLIMMALVILVATVVGSVLRNIYDYRLFTATTSMEDSFRDRGYGRYLHLDAAYHHANSSGQVIGRMDRGAVGVYAIVNDIIGQNLAVPLTYFLVISIMLLIKDFWIALIVILPLPIYMILVQRWSRQIYEIDRRAHDQFDLVGREQYDTASNIMTVKRFGQEDWELVRSRLLRQAARETQYLGERLWLKIDLLKVVIGAVGRGAMIIFAGLLVGSRSISVGEAMLFLTLQTMVNQPMFQLSVLMPRLRRNVARAERLFQIIDESVKIVDVPNCSILKPLERDIEFRNLWFRYGENLPFVLKGVDVRIEKGMIVALVGRSGGGKSTFVNLLMRAYDPTEGGIYIDGANIREASRKSLLRQIAMVSQEIDLFGRTVRENINYGKPDATEEEIKAAAEIALVDEFIKDLENGYDTVIGERGVKLSGGQRQRIGIARAALMKPAILVLDEATNQLDTFSERLVQKAMNGVMQNCTTIIIAHRLSTILRADKIVVFDHGSIDAVGKHEELLEKSKIYQHLYELQFAS